MGASVVFFAIVAVVLSAVMLLNIQRIAVIMQAPAEAFDATCDYIRICSWGLVFITAYNVLGSFCQCCGVVEHHVIFS